MEEVLDFLHGHLGNKRTLAFILSKVEIGDH